jgi:hypothetical protein
METLDGVSGGHPDGTNKQLCTILNCDFDELVQLAMGVVVVCLAG